jgi:hypothetical protein
MSTATPIKVDPATSAIVVGVSPPTTRAMSSSRINGRDAVVTAAFTVAFAAKFALVNAPPKASEKKPACAGLDPAPASMVAAVKPNIAFLKRLFEAAGLADILSLPDWAEETTPLLAGVFEFDVADDDFLAAGLFVNFETDLASTFEDL